MRLIKTFGLAALAAVAAMAFVGVTPASATKTTQLCNAHTSLDCSSAATSVHAILAPGTVGKLLAGLTVLCLGVLVESSGGDVGALAKPQRLDVTSMEFTGCGTGSAHNNCAVIVKSESESLPDNTLLKTGLDSGSLEAISGSTRLICSTIINCVYDLAGSLFSAGANHFTASETPTIELGDPAWLWCPDKGKLDGLLVTLENRYILR